MGASVRGANHNRQGQPNQDALELQTYKTTSASASFSGGFAAVADGHGSAHYFRSDRGAKFAVKAASFAIAEMLERYPGWTSGSDDLQLAKRWLKQHVPQLILHRWIEYVRHDISLQPYGSEEKALMSGRRDGNPKAQPNRPLATYSQISDPELEPYGATLGLALITDAYVAFASLGDVDVVTVTGDGQSVRALAPSEEVGEATHSLCLSDAATHFQVDLHALDDAGRPAMIFVGTDGFSKSYKTEAEFLETCKAYSAAIRKPDAYRVEGELTKWLTETTTSGSGDDVTVGMIYDVSLLHRSETANAVLVPLEGQPFKVSEGQELIDREPTKAPHQPNEADPAQDLLLHDSGVSSSSVEGSTPPNDSHDSSPQQQLEDIRLDVQTSDSTEVKG